MPVLLPDSFAQACAMVADDPERLALAGGTDLLAAWPQRFDRHDATYVDLSQLSELKTITWTDDTLVLGAGITYWNVLRDAAVCEAFPLLAEVARRVGALQIQTRGTWVGNVISAAASADGAAVLLAHDAVVELESLGESESVPLSDFFAGLGSTRLRGDQLVRAIRIPRRSCDVQIFEKVGTRAAQATTILSLSVLHSASGWRVVAGGMAPRVVRCPSFERLLDNAATLDTADDLLPAIRADLSAGDDSHASAVYRERVLARVAITKLSEAVPWVQGRL